MSMVGVALLTNRHKKIAVIILFVVSLTYYLVVLPSSSSSFYQQQSDEDDFTERGAVGEASHFSHLEVSQQQLTARRRRRNDDKIHHNENNNLKIIKKTEKIKHTEAVDAKGSMFAEGVGTTQRIAAKYEKGGEEDSSSTNSATIPCQKELSSSLLSSNHRKKNISEEDNQEILESPKWAHVFHCEWPCPPVTKVVSPSSSDHDDDDEQKNCQYISEHQTTPSASEGAEFLFKLKEYVLHYDSISSSHHNASTGLEIYLRNFLRYKVCQLDEKNTMGASKPETRLLGDKIRAADTNLLRDAVDCTPQSNSVKKSSAGSSLTFKGVRATCTSVLYPKRRLKHQVVESHWGKGPPLNFTLRIDDAYFSTKRLKYPPTSASEGGGDLIIVTRRKEASSENGGITTSLPPIFSSGKGRDDHENKRIIANSKFTTEYHRQGRAAWLRLNNVCATMEKKGQFFMNLNRERHLTLWSIGNSVEYKLSVPSRHGRHSIFFEREGSYQYGGFIRPSALRQMVMKNKRVVGYMHGTTIFNAPFQVNNIGHCLHDGHWAFHAGLLSLPDAEVPRPYRVLMDVDFFHFSGPFHAVLNTIIAEVVLKKPHFLNPLLMMEKEDDERKKQRLSTTTVAKGQRDGNNGDDDEDTTNVSSGTLPLLCFETLIVSGGDRSGNNGGYHRSRRWAVAGNLRQTMLRALGLNPFQTRKNPQIFIYGRTEVHRRSIDNLGLLWRAVKKVSVEHQVPDPIIIANMTLHPLDQIELMSQVDILITVQGAHEQASVCMPSDGVILEICPCLAKKTSFLYRYGVFLPKQKLWQMQICGPSVLNVGFDKYGQNLTLCEDQVTTVTSALKGYLVHMIRERSAAHR